MLVDDVLSDDGPEYRAGEDVAREMDVVVDPVERDERRECVGGGRDDPSFGPGGDDGGSAEME